MLFVVIECCWVTHLFWVRIAWIMQAIIHMVLYYLPVYLCIGRLSYLEWLCSWVYSLHINLANDTSSLHIFQVFFLDVAILTLDFSLIRVRYQTLVVNHHCFMIHTNHLRFKFGRRRLLLWIWEIHANRRAFWWHAPLLIHVQILLYLSVLAVLSYYLRAHIITGMLEMWQCLNLHHTLLLTTLH